MKNLLLILVTASFLGCAAEGGSSLAKRKARTSLFIGIDVSGSFYNSGHYENSIDFLSKYIHAHLNNVGGLNPLKSLFVGAIGGQRGDEVKSFRPIHDFQNKSADEIKKDLLAWFPKSDSLTDFNIFFKSVANIAKKRNLSLAPVTILLVSDGKPDFPGIKGDPIANVDMSNLEYLARNVTVRLLYPDSVTAHKWETEIPRKRVRLWTVDKKVMTGWKNQYVESRPLTEQGNLWRWVRDNVNYRVKRNPTL